MQGFIHDFEFCRGELQISVLTWRGCIAHNNWGGGGGGGGWRRGVACAKFLSTLCAPYSFINAL